MADINMLGMDPEKAKTAMNKVKGMKSALQAESTKATTVLNEKVNAAFAGTQTSSMQGFISRINASLEKLYSYLDGNDSNFAKTFGEAITSYVTSDQNVSNSYANTDTEQ